MRVPCICSSGDALTMTDEPQPTSEPPARNSPCTCGHLLVEHVAASADPRQRCIWSRAFGYAPTKEPAPPACDCTGFRALEKDASAIPSRPPQPLDMLEALCVCGHVLGEHLPWWRAARQPSTSGRARGDDRTTPYEPPPPATARGTSPGFGWPSEPIRRIRTSPRPSSAWAGDPRSLSTLRLPLLHDDTRVRGTRARLPARSIVLHLRIRGRLRMELPGVPESLR